MFGDVVRPRAASQSIAAGGGGAVAADIVASGFVASRILAAGIAVSGAVGQVLASPAESGIRACRQRHRALRFPGRAA